MKAFLIGLVLGLISSVSFAGILPTSRGGTGANIAPVAGKFVFSTSSGFTLANIIPSGGTLGLSSGTTLAAPLVIPSGSTLNTPYKGSIESNGTHIWWTDNSGVRHLLDNSGAP